MQSSLESTKSGAEVLLPWALLAQDGPTGQIHPYLSLQAQVRALHW